MSQGRGDNVAYGGCSLAQDRAQRLKRYRVASGVKIPWDGKRAVLEDCDDVPLVVRALVRLVQAHDALQIKGEAEAAPVVEHLAAELRGVARLVVHEAQRSEEGASRKVACA